MYNPHTYYHGRNTVIISLVKKFIGVFKKTPPPVEVLEHATIIPRSEHCISQADISGRALQVVKRLTKAGHRAYLVGGCVRDLLLHHAPKDFDVATDAQPEDVYQLFRNCRLIGRRFRLAHILFGREIVEVATFRAEHTRGDDAGQKNQGMIVRDNVFGRLDEDAWRRDFSVNALYYDVNQHTIIDFTDGFTDLAHKNLRLIGDPDVRFREDPARILRAIRFSVKLDLAIESKTEQMLITDVELLRLVAPARLFDEVLKLYHSGMANKMHSALARYGAYDILFPVTNHIQQTHYAEPAAQLIQTVLNNTDKRVSEDKPITPAFLFATLLWHPFQQELAQLEHLPPAEALIHAMRSVIRQQNQVIHIPKRFSVVIQEIWLLQYRLHKRNGSRAFRLFTHPRFRAGYDFLVLRAQIGEADQQLADWWTTFQEVTPDQRDEMISALQNTQKRARKKPRKKKPAAK